MFVVFFARTMYSEIQAKEKDKETWPNFPKDLKELIAKLQEEGRSEMKKENALVKSDRNKDVVKSKNKRKKRKSDSSSASSHPPTPSSAVVKKRKKKDKEVSRFCQEDHMLLCRRLTSIGFMHILHGACAISCR